MKSTACRLWAMLLLYICPLACRLSVPVVGVSLDEHAILISIGSTRQLEATVEPVQATTKTVSWKSSDEDIVTVDSEGVVSATAVGSAVVTVTTTDGDFTDSCTVTAVIAGTLDTTFNSVGYVIHSNAAMGNGDDIAQDVTIDVSGKILAAGFSLGDHYDLAVWRYNSSGTLDTSFYSAGYTIHDGAAGSPGSDDRGFAITTDVGGNILVGGQSNRDWDAYEDFDMAMWRYTGSGSLDPTFNAVGYATHNGPAGEGGGNFGQGITVDGDGKILVAGLTWTVSEGADLIVWRCNSDGSLDTSFNAVGYAVHDSAAGGGGNDAGNALVLDANGKILVTGNSMNGSDSDMVIWRFNTDGTLDTSFNSVGYVVHDNAAGGSGNDSGEAILLDANGKILVAGCSNNGSNFDMVIWRYNTDGSLDTTFNSVGYVVHNGAAGGNGSDSAWDIALDRNGKILVAGISSNGSNDDMALWRYNIDGSLDTSFHSVGYTVHNGAAGGSGWDYGYAIAVDGKERIIVAGCSSNGSNSDMVIWRYID